MPNLGMGEYQFGQANQTIVVEFRFPSLHDLPNQLDVEQCLLVGQDGGSADVAHDAEGEVDYLNLLVIEQTTHLIMQHIIIVQYGIDVGYAHGTQTAQQVDGTDDHGFVVGAGQQQDGLVEYLQCIHFECIVVGRCYCCQALQDREHD